MDTLRDLERNPYLSEMAYFASAPNVAGMMTEDGRVILRPDIFGNARDAVKLNELLRLKLSGYTPKSKLNDVQTRMFSGTPYEYDKENAMRSIIARQISGDPSANTDFTQDSEIRNLRTLGNLLGGY